MLIARKLNTNRYANILLWVIAVAFILWALRFIYLSSFVAWNGHRYYALFDDAMISMRYAWNFGHGNGLVWNPGERVEGYTNLLTVLVMAVPNAVLEQRFAVLSMQLFGIVTILGVAYLTGRIVALVVVPSSVTSLADITAETQRKEGDIHSFLARNPGILKWIGFAGVLLYYPLVYWSLMGMETGLFSFLLLFALVMLFSYQPGKSLRPVKFMAVALGLCYLTRPESVLISGLLLLYFCAIVPRPAGQKIPWRPILIVGGLFALLPLAQHLFRWWYYGELFANTYTLKTQGLPLGERIGYGWDYTWPFLREHALLLFIALAGVIVHFNRRRLLLAGIVGVMIAYQIFIGGEPPEWTYWRVVAPVIPLLFVLVIDVLATFSIAHPARPIQALVMVIGLAAFLQPLQRHRDEQLLAIPPYQAQLNAINVNKALLIAAITTNEASIGVSWGGAIPYYNPGHYAIDYLGKSDPYIAGLTPRADDPMRRWPGHNKHDLAYSIQTLQPTFSETFSYTVEDITAWAQRHYVALAYNRDTILYFKLDDSAVDFDRALELGLFPWLQWSADALFADWTAAVGADAQILLPANSYGFVTPPQVVSAELVGATNATALAAWEDSRLPEYLQSAGVTHLLVDSGWWSTLSETEQGVISNPANYELIQEWQVGPIFLRFYRVLG